MGARENENEEQDKRGGKSRDGEEHLKEIIEETTKKKSQNDTNKQPFQMNAL